MGGAGCKICESEVDHHPAHVGLAKYTPSGKTPEDRLLNIRDTLLKMITDLTCSSAEEEMQTNTWIHTKMVKVMPFQWQTKYADQEDNLIVEKGTKSNSKP